MVTLFFGALSKKDMWCYALHEDSKCDAACCCFFSSLEAYLAEGVKTTHDVLAPLTMCLDLTILGLVSNSEEFSMA